MSSKHYKEDETGKYRRKKEKNKKTCDFQHKINMVIGRKEKKGEERRGRKNKRKEGRKEQERDEEI